MESRRVYNYDLIKAVAIFLICLYHYGTISNDIVHYPSYSNYFLYFISGVSSIGVPLFLLVNGAILLNRSYDLKKHLIKTGTVFLLLVFWSTVTLLLTETNENNITPFTKFIKTVFFFEQHRTRHLWFLQAIIYLYLLFPFIKALYDLKEPKYTYYLMAIAFVFTFGNEVATNLINTIGYFFGIGSLKNREIYIFDYINPFYFYCSFSLVYFIMGGLLGKYIKAIPYNAYLYWGLFLLSLLMLFGLGVIKSSGQNEIYDTVWEGYDTIMTLIMSLVVFLVCMKEPITSECLKDILHLIGSNTLGIYFIHVPVGFWLTEYYKSFTFSAYMMMDFIYSLLLLLLSLAVTLLLKAIPLVKRTVQL